MNRGLGTLTSLAGRLGSGRLPFPNESARHHCGSFAVLLAALFVVSAYPRFKKIERRGLAPESVSAVLLGDGDAAVAAVGAAFNDWTDYIGPNRPRTFVNKFPGSSKWSQLFLFRKNDARHPLFPADEEILLDRGADSFVEGYVRIPAELRSRDLYLYEPSGDYFWGSSEYFYKGQPAKFRCSFFIHLEPAGNAGTKVELFEYQPTIWVGEYLGLSAHAIWPCDAARYSPRAGDYGGAQRGPAADRGRFQFALEYEANSRALRRQLVRRLVYRPR